MLKKIITVIGSIALLTISSGAQDIKSDLNEIETIMPSVGALNKAKLYRYGYPKENIEPDIKKALEYYKIAFEEGSAEAGYELGKVAWEMDPTNRESILFYFAKCADMEPELFANACGVTAGVYLYSQKDYKKAEKVLKKYAKISDPLAELYLAFIYRNKGNSSKANMYLSRACTNPKAKENKEIVTFCDSNNTKKFDINSGRELEKQQRLAGCSLSQ